MNVSALARAATGILLIGGLAACGASDPPGSAAGRATDRALGTNMSGAYPSQRDGTPGNPPGTMIERVVDPTPPVRRNPRNPGL